MKAGWMGIGLGLCVGLCWGSSEEGGADYEIVEVPPLPGYPRSSARAVTESGAVLASAYIFSDRTEKFVWKPGSVQVLGKPRSTDRKIEAYAIGEDETVVGGVQLANGIYVACKWTGGIPTELNSESSTAFAINREGQIAGHLLGQAVIWQPDGAVRRLGFPSGTTSSFAQGINDLGSVVGYALSASRERHAFAYRDGAMQSLGRAGAIDTTAEAINNAGSIVGEARLVPSRILGARWQPDSLEILPEPAQVGSYTARAINSAGDAVGYLRNEIEFVPVLWRDGEVINVNSLLPPGSPWVLTTALDINDRGWIVGSGTLAGTTRGYLLRPPTPLRMRVDQNRDGRIDFDGESDAGEEGVPFEFWINDDIDRRERVGLDEYEEDDEQSGRADSADTKILCKRDLEDFVRLQIRPPSAYAPQDPSWRVQISMEEITGGSPAIRLWPAVESDLGYLTDIAAADRQLAEWRSYLTGPGAAVSLSAENFSRDDRLACFIFEGVQAGQGQLVVRFFKGEEEVATDTLPLHLKPITDFYERYATGEEGAAVGSYVRAGSFVYPAPEREEERDYILFIHGWNLATWEKDRFAETAYKRLWHQGYRGRFGLFRWPTLTGLLTYNPSEFRAWASAEPARKLLRVLDHRYPDRVRLIAHSMGNVVASEALRSAGEERLVHTYVAAQAAVPAHAFDASADHDMRFERRYGPETPNVYAAYWEPDADCYFQSLPGAATCINYFNPVDFALAEALWEFNQKLKPQSGYDYHAPRGKSPRGGFGKREPTYPGYIWRQLTFPDQRYEIFSHAAEARSRALGTRVDVDGVFSPEKQVDLNEKFSFGERHVGHSAQFRSFIHARSGFWAQLLVSFEIQVP